MTKKPHRSKTVLFGLALVVFGALMDSFPELRNIIDERYYGILVTVVGVIVAVLRFYTTGPLDK